jgi:hypothetical protein
MSEEKKKDKKDNIVKLPFNLRKMCEEASEKIKQQAIERGFPSLDRVPRVFYGFVESDDNE